LPQFRTSFQVPATEAQLRIHFVHAQSPFANAVPLLLIPPFPFTSLSLGQFVALLTDPDDAAATQPFHLVIPSLPGLGFSDALRADVPMISTTANILDLLMKRLGYDHYIASTAGPATSSPSDIDWQVANHLCFHYQDSCLGVHIISPPLQPPKFKDSPVEWAKWKLASTLRSPIFGYAQEDFEAIETTKRLQHGKPFEAVPWLFGGRGNANCEPNTLAYALCDSPTGLLLFVLTILRVFGPRATFSPSDIITMTELTWLPGPESALRFWAYSATHSEEIRKQATKPKAAITVFLGDKINAVDQETENSKLPRPMAGTYACPSWASAQYHIVSTNRLPGSPGLLAWEQPQVIADGVRRLAKAILATDKRMQKHELPGTALLEQVVVHGGEQIAKAEVSGTTVEGTASPSSDLTPGSQPSKAVPFVAADGLLAPPTKQVDASPKQVA
jgi:pimeloyl-ACP methyl ester carboxylesterase